MKVLILHYYCGYIDGTFTSIIDTYYNLLKFGVDVELKIITYWNISKTIRHIISNFGTHDLLKITNETNFKSNVVICSACFLYNNFEHPIKDLNIIADKIIVLDSLDIYLSKYKIKCNYGILPPLNDVVDNNCILLTNPIGFNSCSYPTFEYYHKLSNRRLDNPKHIKNIIQNRETFTYSRITKHSAFLNEIIGYAENIGKSIFERLYYGIPVNYSADCYVKDGLHYYLKQFGIDPTQDYFPLPITKQDIVNKLCMNDDDLLIKLLE